LVSSSFWFVGPNEEQAFIYVFFGSFLGFIDIVSFMPGNFLNGFGFK